nr:hypothetical protein [Tanacetum cinerariifolium]
MEVDIEKDKNEPELTYPYEEMDPLNPLPPASKSEPEDAIEVENPIEHEDEIVPASVHEVGESFTAPLLREDNDGLFLGLIRRDINSLFGRMASLLRRLFGRETTDALVEKKEKAKDEFYGKLILDLGNEVHSSVEQQTNAMEKLVEKLGNVVDKVECKKLKKELEEARVSNTFLRIIMPPKSAPLTQAAIHRMIKDNVDATIAAESELLRWFEKSESVFGISECAEGKKVRFATATLQGPTLTWWNAKVATWHLETVNRMPWTKMKHLMTVVFCLIEEIQRMKHVLWNLKVDAYIWGLIDIKGEVTSSRSANLNQAMRMVHKLMDQKAQARDERILEGNKRKWESFQNGNSSGEGHTKNRCPKKVKQEEVAKVCSRAYAIKDADPKGPNVVTSTFLINNCYAFVLFDPDSDRIFMDTRFSSMLAMDPVKIGASYEVELADGRVVRASGDESNSTGMRLQHHRLILK